MPQRTHTTSANRAVLIKGGKAYFQLLDELISSATTSIHFQFYIFDADETGRAVADALMAAVKRGVKVYVLLDAYGSQALPKTFVSELKESGIQFRWFQPMFRSRKFYLGRRLHHKVVVADGYKSLVGGLNISDRYNDTEEAPAWLDWALYCEGEVSAQLESICKTRMRVRSPKNTNHPQHPGGSIDLSIRVNDWVSSKAQITTSYLRMLQTAQQEVIIMSPYFLPGYQFRRKLKRAAQRGVNIQVILTADSDVPLAKRAERFMYHWLLKNNITIWEYQKNVLHGKVAVADGHWATVGSYNVNNLSAYASVELNLEVNTATLARNIEKNLHEIIQRDCVQITQEDFNKQSTVFNRFANRFAYNVLRLGLFIFTLRIRHRE